MLHNYEVRDQNDHQPLLLSSLLKKHMRAAAPTCDPLAKACIDKLRKRASISCESVHRFVCESGRRFVCESGRRFVCESGRRLVTHMRAAFYISSMFCMTSISTETSIAFPEYRSLNCLLNAASMPVIMLLIFSIDSVMFSLLTVWF